MLLDTSSTARLCDELAWLRSRYDTGQVAPCVYGVIKKIEVELGWRARTGHPRRGGCVMKRHLQELEVLERRNPDGRKILTTRSWFSDTQPNGRTYLGARGVGRREGEATGK
jgi:hypothetical protein